MTEKRLLITGGTGFLGRHLGLQLRQLGWTVFLGARNNKLNMEAQALSGCEAVPMDVSSLESTRDAVVRVRPDVIVHAAATKFVDLAEKFPLECVDINVVGSQNVARVAVDRGVGVVLGISTDKASPPIRNLYGLSKSVMERMFCYLDGVGSTRFACVRYGNVAWSTGSVLCIWTKMARDKGVIGTTGPEMRRFFFTVDDAVGLVTTALDNIDSIHGRVLGREMKAAKIRDLLDVWQKSDGTRYEVIAGRPGERNDEYLVGDIELPYTRELEFDGVRHFLIGFNERVAAPLASGLSSENASPLTEAEILTLLKNPPPGAV